MTPKTSGCLLEASLPALPHPIRSLRGCVCRTKVEAASLKKAGLTPQGGHVLPSPDPQKECGELAPSPDTTAAEVIRRRDP